MLLDCRFCAHLKVSENTQILAPFLPKIMDGLLTLATQSTDDVLALVLESLRIVMSVSVVLCLSGDERSGKRIVWVRVYYAGCLAGANRQRFPPFYGTRSDFS